MLLVVGPSLTLLSYPSPTHFTLSNLSPMCLLPSAAVACACMHVWCEGVRVRRGGSSESSASAEGVRVIQLLRHHSESGGGSLVHLPTCQHMPRSPPTLLSPQSEPPPPPARSNTKHSAPITQNTARLLRCTHAVTANNKHTSKHAAAHRQLHSQGCGLYQPTTSRCLPSRGASWGATTSL